MRCGGWQSTGTPHRLELTDPRSTRLMACDSAFGGMMVGFDAGRFAATWASAWNARDLASVLAHFHEDVIFTSPIAAQIDPATSGIVRGKEALSSYWRAALAKNPHLHFTVTEVFEGIDSVFIRFRNEMGADRIEALRFRDGLVAEGHGTFKVAHQALERR